MMSSRPQPSTQIEHRVGNRLRTVAHLLRHRRRIRLCIRAAWIALAVWCVGLLFALLGIAIPLQVLAGASLAALLAGLGYAWLRRPSLRQLARGMDSFYALDEQLGTALEVARRGAHNPLEQRLLYNADAILGNYRRYVQQQPRVPWREVETLGAMALLALGLTIANRPLEVPSQQVQALPTLPPSTQPTETAQPEPVEEEQPVADRPQPQANPAGQAAAEALADALRDNGATRAAAEALDRGELSDAANRLRERADQADQLGERARRDIAEGLRDAADQLAEEQPELADRLREQAEALERGGQSAEEALEDLARAVEQLGTAEQPAAQGETPDAQASAGDQTAQAAGEEDGRAQGTGEQDGMSGGSGAGSGLGGETRSTGGPGIQAQGENVPLPESDELDGPTTSATGPQGPTLELESRGTGAPSNNNVSGPDRPLPGAPDPLTIPLEYRDVVEEYFTPAP